MSLSEKSIIEIKNDKNIDITSDKFKKSIKCLIIKFILFFIFSLAFLCLFWYYLGCFCAVYKNTQIPLLKDTLISFVLSMIYPFGTCLLPGIFRIIALKDKKKE